MLTTKPTLSLSLKIKKENNVEPEPAQTTETVVDNNVSEEISPTDNANQIVSIIPKIVFIVPYRDRTEHKVFFSVYMKHILEDIPKTDYEIYYVEQKDRLPFNRGAMKNIGFLAIKYKYPDHYKDISFVFNDIDTVPYSKNVIQYETTQGVVKHFYGFKFALGGIFSIKGGDYEITNGFPNFWSWGGEDNYMQKRVEQARLLIDRTCFFEILDKNILQLCDGIKRLICRKEAATVVNMTTMDGLITIRNLNYEFKDEYINVYHFETTRDPRSLRFEEQNIVTETKIRLDKEDVKNLLQRKMNEVRLPNHYTNQTRPQTQPQTQPHPHIQPRPQLRPQQRPPQQAYPQPQPRPPPQNGPQASLRQHHTQRPASQGNFSSRMGMGGLSK
jgi:hypothetical protein